MIDDEFTKRYQEVWQLAFRRGSSFPEELDRHHMLNTKQQQRTLINKIANELEDTAPHQLSALIPVPLEAATFADGVRAAIAWMDKRAKEIQ